MNERSRFAGDPRETDPFFTGNYTETTEDPNINPEIEDTRPTPFDYLSSLTGEEESVRLQGRDMDIEIKKVPDPNELFDFVQVLVFEQGAQDPIDAFALARREDRQLIGGFRTAETKRQVVDIPYVDIDFRGNMTREQQNLSEFLGVEAVAQYVRDQTEPTAPEEDNSADE